MPTGLHLTFQPLNASPYTIEVLSTGFDIEQSLNIGSTSSGAGAGKVVFDPFHFTKKPDAHSPDLWLRCCNGTPFPKVSLAVTSGGAATPFLTFTMGIVGVKTVSFSASESDGIPVESVTFEYGQFGYSFTPQNPDGSSGALVTIGWDGTRNMPTDGAKVGV